MRKITLLLVLFLSTIYYQQTFAQAESYIDLTKSFPWYFKQANDSVWLSASVPGTVHQDLMAHQLMEDPYLLNNEKQSQWPEYKEWLYRSNIFIDEKLWKQEHLTLVFEGLDTDAEIYINGNKIASVNNMFRTWEFEIRSYLKKGNNDLLIKFLATSKNAALAYAKLQPKIPLDERAMCRKAAYQFGWDWGPRLVTAGIYKNVYLHVWNEIKIANIHYQQIKIDTLLAVVNAKATIYSEKANVVTCKIYDQNIQEEYASQQVSLKKGFNEIDIPFNISRPKLWWCNGLGDPNIMDLKFTLSDNKNTYSRNTKIGLRKIELVQQQDQKGKSFYFKLNGIAVFMKGANYIPQDNFTPRVTVAQTKNLIMSAKAANFNMLRVWGGGIYESDAFYQACDESGILVWQDFMFACGLVPGGEEFANNVRQEVVDQVIRLRNHPCIALWCGNNEVAEGWSNWGWQKQYAMNATDSSRIWSDYQHLFHQVIPSVIDKLSSGIAYWPSSPQFGWGRKESLTSGDLHYWGVWWGEEPFEMYPKKVGRFVSEYGFQSLPNLQTIEKFSNLSDRNLQSKVIQAHQKHSSGFKIIDQQMGLYYQKPSAFEDYVYASQVLQAEGLKTAIEAHRSAMPYCMGTLYWQFNDCWPVVSWSSADYYQNKKAAFYFVKKSFETNLLTFKKQKDSLQVYLVSDSLHEMQVAYNLRVMDFSGKVFWETNQSLKVAPQSVTLLSQQSINSLIAKHLTQNLMAVATVYKADGSSTEQIYYFEAVKNLTLNKDTILMTQTVQNNQLEITLNTSSLKKNIQLTTTVAGEFSDNYFDLLPNQPKKIYFKLSNENDYNNMPATLSGTLKAINIQVKYLVNSILKK